MNWLRRALNLIRGICALPLSRRFRGGGVVGVAEIPPRPAVAPEYEELVAAMRRRLETGELFQPLLDVARGGVIVKATYRRDGGTREYAVVACPDGEEE